MMQKTSYFRPLGLLALALLSYLAAQGTGIRLFFHLFYLLLALLALSYLWAWSNLHGLRVERESFTQRSQVGDEARDNHRDADQEQVRDQHLGEESATAHSRQA